MKSTGSSYLVKILSLAVLAVAASPMFANAQEMKGSFTLPFEAHWGGVTLSPGDYTITLDPAARPYISVSQGPNGVGFVQTIGISDDTKSGGSAMVAVPTDEGYTITSLHLEEMGVTLHFTQPKPKPSVLAQGPTLNRRVPILMASK